MKKSTWNQKVFDSGHCRIIPIPDVKTKLAEFADSGHLNDPDMLIVGIYRKIQATSNQD